MRRILACIKAAVDWAGSIYAVLGFFGGTAIASSIAVTVGGVVWAVIARVPVPILVMAAYCTLAGGVCLSVVPLAYRALSRISVLEPTIDNKPDIEVWRYKEEFWLYE